MSDHSDLSSQVGAFTHEITQTIQSVLGRQETTLRATLLDDKFTVTTPRDALIGLHVAGEPLLDLKVRFECGWDYPQRYMAVHAAEFHVFAHANAQPLFRYEFVKKPSESVPSAHLQIHAHRDAFTWAMTSAGRRSKRSKARSRQVLTVPPSMSEVHFPLGGRRFRPALEDVLQMLVEEFGIDAADGWRARLAEARSRWRRAQIKAAVRDAPEDAAEALRGLGYVVTHAGALPADNPDALRQY